MNVIARFFNLSTLALSLLVLSSCGDGAAPAANSGGATSGKTPANLATVPAADTTADFVLKAEKCWSENDRANTIEMYNKAILSATKEGNTVQAQIFAKRLAEIEKKK